MPIFMVRESPKTVSVHLSAEGKVAHHGIARKGNDIWTRIGTAHGRPDGGFTIRLDAIPLTGTLVMRPAQPGESPDPTQSVE
jgi:hypothetical protein